MKRTLSLLLTFALLFGLLAACGGQPQSSPEPPAVFSEPLPTQEPSPAPSTPQPSASADTFDGPDVIELAEAVLAASGCEDPSAVERINAGENADMLAFYVENAYGLTEWEDAAVIRATGASAFEIAVLRCADDGAAVRAATEFMSYIFARQGDFTGYAPEQADMVAAGSINQQGPYATLFICPEPSWADAAFDAALNGTEAPVLPSTEPSPEPAEPSAEPSVEPTEPTPETSVEPAEPEELPAWVDRYLFTQPNKDDMSLYDTAAILAAWKSGSPDGLSDYDRAIYEAAKAVLDKTITDSMSDYEKEKALYQWTVRSIDYDWTHQNILAHTPRESFTPYGGLVNHTAVCLGYATTFQLLMDLAGVECITVAGAAFRSSEDHAWNMVRLDGNWYCVDVTWDANWREQGATSGDPGEWNYFNVTSEVMAISDHQWDYANTPEAVTEGNGN